MKQIYILFTILFLPFSSINAWSIDSNAENILGTWHIDYLEDNEKNTYSKTINDLIILDENMITYQIKVSDNESFRHSTRIIYNGNEIIVGPDFPEDQMQYVILYHDDKTMTLQTPDGIYHLYRWDWINKIPY